MTFFKLPLPFGKAPFSLFLLLRVRFPAIAISILSKLLALPFDSCMAACSSFTVMKFGTGIGMVIR
jgi:hypothetical protein